MTHRAKRGDNAPKKVQCEESDEYWSTVGNVDTDGEERAYSYCAKKGTKGGEPPFDADGPDNWQTGNYVKSAVEDYGTSKEKIIIMNVFTEQCDPKPANCNCKSLLDRVIKKFPNATTIELEFVANPADRGCKCYLGTAARNGFTSVELKKCKEVVDFDEKNYDQKCNALRPCALESDWFIKKKK